MDTTKLPKLMQDAIKSLKELHNAPLEMSLPAVLAVVNLACQGRYNASTAENYGKRRNRDTEMTIPLSMNFVVIAPTAASKSTIYNELMVGVDKWQDEMLSQLPMLTEKYDLDMALYDKEREKYKRDPQNYVIQLKKPFPVSRHEYHTGKGTVNGLIALLETQPMLGLFSSEGAEFFQGHAFQGNKSEAARALEMVGELTKMWDGQTLTKNTGPHHTLLQNRRVCMFLMIQDNAFRDFLNNRNYSEQGFTHRLLITKSESFVKPEMPFTVDGKTKKKASRSRLNPFHDQTYDLISRSFRIKQDTAYELDLPIIEMNIEAEELLATYFNQTRDKRILDEDKWQGFCNRLHEHTLRIAANLAVFQDKKAIDQTDMIAAIEIFEFFLDQRANLEMDITPVNPEIVDAAEKLKKLIIRKSYDGKVSELSRLGTGGYQHSAGDYRLKIIGEVLTDPNFELYVKNGVNYIRRKP